MVVEQLDELGEVGERAGQAVDLVDNHDIDLALADIRKKLLKGGAIYRPAGDPSIIIVGFDELPAFVGLALDVGLRRLALGIERVEVLFEPMLG